MTQTTDLMMKQQFQRPLFSVLAAALALSSSCVDAPPPLKPRAARTLLTDSLGDLSGQPVKRSEDGPWTLRVAASSGVAKGGPAGGVTSITASLGDAPGEHLGVTLATPPSGGGGGFAGPGSDMPYGGGPAAGGPTSPGRALMLESRARTGLAGGGGAAAAPLRAGTTDDNEGFDDFLKYLDEQRENKLFAQAADLDVSRRVMLSVEDAEGRPLPGAVVRVVDPDRDAVVWRGRCYGDGRVPFYPSLLGEREPETFLIEVEYGDETLRAHWNGSGDSHRLQLSAATAPTADADVQLDVVFLIDTTGSMGDEIDRIKASLLGMTAKIRELDRGVSLRYGAVLYRDITDAYVTKAHPFTADLAAFDKALSAIAAGGGGDSPESLNQGLAVAVDGMEWRPTAAKLVFLVADAPPHMDYENDVSYGDGLRAAVARGIRVHAVAASGLDAVGSLVFRQIAQFSRGKFVFIEYGGNIKASAEEHGVKGPVKANNLDDILFDQIEAEIEGWGRAAAD